MAAWWRLLSCVLKNGSVWYLWFHTTRCACFAFSPSMIAGAPPAGQPFDRQHGAVVCYWVKFCRRHAQGGGHGDILGRKNELLSTPLSSLEDHLALLLYGRRCAEGSEKTPQCTQVSNSEKSVRSGHGNGCTRRIGGRRPRCGENFIFLLEKQKTNGFRALQGIVA